VPYRSCLIVVVLALFGLASSASVAPPPPLHACQPGIRDPQARLCMKQNATMRFHAPSFRATGVVQEYFLSVPVGDGRNWSAFVHIPAKLPNVTGALFAYHGANATGLFMSCYTGLSRQADALGFVMIYPTASWDTATTNKSWPMLFKDAGPYLSYWDALLKLVLSQGNVDPKRIFLTGVSNGGNMITLLSRLRAKVISGIAMDAGTYYITENLTAPPARPISIFCIHGTSDPVVKYSTIPPWLAHWAKWNGFHGKVIQTEYSVKSLMYTWTNLAPGVKMAHIKVITGGHAWPCSDYAYGPPPQTFSASSAVAHFFFAKLGDAPDGKEEDPVE